MKFLNVRREMVLFLFATVLGLLSLLRLSDIQLIQGDKLLVESEDNRLYRVTTPQNRGVFLDRFQQALVSNAAAAYKKSSLTSLYSEEFQVSHAEMLRLIATESAAVSSRLFRHYPYQEAMAHVLGYTTQVTQEDLRDDDKLNIFDQKGRMGLESSYQKELEGKNGSELYEIDALGKKQRIVEVEKSQPGSIIKTTLDPFLSKVAYKAMNDLTGAVVVLDADTGAVLTMLSTPSFDSNYLSAFYSDPAQEKKRKEQVTEYLSDGKQRFFNRALSGLYPPGSVFKIVTALTGLEAQKIDEKTTVLDEGILKVGEYSYANWYYSQYGRVEGEIGIKRALARSNDIFFYKVAEWVGPEVLAETAQIFGFGNQVGIDLDGEARGLVPTPEWKEHQVGERWFLGNTYHFGIGQGDLLVTPVQVASMTQAVANQGVTCTPFLAVKDKPQCKSLSISDDHINIVLEGMIEACSQGGTAFPFFDVNEKLKLNKYGSASEKLDAGAVACKTGTAEFGGSNSDGFRNTHGWFIAIFDTQLDFRQSNTVSESAKSQVASESAVLDERKKWLSFTKEYGYPRRLAVAVLVESDQSQPYREGSRDAAPVAREIFNWVRGSIKD